MKFISPLFTTASAAFVATAMMQQSAEGRRAETNAEVPKRVLKHHPYGTDQKKGRNEHHHHRHHHDPDQHHDHHHHHNDPDQHHDHHHHHHDPDQHHDHHHHHHDPEHHDHHHHHDPESHHHYNDPEHNPTDSKKSHDKKKHRNSEKKSKVTKRNSRDSKHGTHTHHKKHGNKHHHFDTNLAENSIPHSIELECACQSQWTATACEQWADRTEALSWEEEKCSQECCVAFFMNKNDGEPTDMIELQGAQNMNDLGETMNHYEIVLQREDVTLPEAAQNLRSRPKEPSA